MEAVLIAVMPLSGVVGTMCSVGQDYIVATGLCCLLFYSTGTCVR